MLRYKYGTASFVEIGKFKAKKHMLLSEMFWSKEYSTLLYLWKYKHSNIIRYESGSYLDRLSPTKPHQPISTKKERYYELTFPKYENTLLDYSIYDDSRIIQVMIDLLSAITLCHKLKIWHRDIKPANIMIEGDRAILIDFTHAVRIRTKNIKLDKAVATYSHRAPEIFLYVRNVVQSYNEKIDVWALGVILFELVIDSSMYVHMTPEHTEEETDAFFNESIPKKYLHILHGIYQKHKRTLFHRKTYWTWIKSMLTYSADKRPSAEEMLNNIIVFARANDIDFVMPTNRRVDVERPTFMKKRLTEKQTLLFNSVMKWINLVHAVNTVNFDITNMHNVYKMLIMSNTLENHNKIHVAFAAYILVTSVIYDHVVDLFYLIELANHVSMIVITEKSLQTAMISVMQNHETDLFLTNRFKF